MKTHECATHTYLSKPLFVSLVKRARITTTWIYGYMEIFVQMDISDIRYAQILIMFSHFVIHLFSKNSYTIICAQHISVWEELANAVRTVP